MQNYQMLFCCYMIPQTASGSRYTAVLCRPRVQTGSYTTAKLQFAAGVRTICHVKMLLFTYMVQRCARTNIES